MAKICKKCGREIDGNSPICMNCGAVVPDSQLNQETKERIKAEAHDSHKASNASSVKAVGAILLIIGIVIDVVSMFMIFSLDVSGFFVLTIVGTICFIIGIALVRNG